MQVADDDATEKVWKVFGGAPPPRFTLSVTSVGRWCSVRAGEGMVGSVTWGMSYTDLRRPKSVLRCPARLVCLPLIPDGSCEATVTLPAGRKGSQPHQKRVLCGLKGSNATKASIVLHANQPCTQP